MDLAPDLVKNPLVLELGLHLLEKSNVLARFVFLIIRVSGYFA